jgi:hypothetical protein
LRAEPGGAADGRPSCIAACEPLSSQTRRSGQQVAEKSRRPSGRRSRDARSRFGDDYPVDVRMPITVIGDSGIDGSLRTQVCKLPSGMPPPWTNPKTGISFTTKTPLPSVS